LVPSSHRFICSITISPFFHLSTFFSFASSFCIAFFERTSYATKEVKRMIQLFTDGASSGSPGTSGIGLFLKGEGHLIHISEPIADTNNHEAEFIALIRGLEEARALGTDFVLAHTDSKTVADAVQAKRTSNRTFQPYVQRLLT